MRFIGMAAAVGLLAGCATALRVAAPAPGAFDPGSYSTFAFVPPRDNAATGPGGDDLTARIRQTVQEVLRAKGYAARPEDEADLLVAFYTNIGVAADLAPAAYSVGRWEEANPPVTTAPETPGGPDVQSRTIQQWQTGYHHDAGGYLDMLVVVDVVDARTGELVWRGWAQRQEPMRAVTADEITAAIRAVLRELPAR
jgi:hypothetical protein